MNSGSFLTNVFASGTITVSGTIGGSIGGLAGNNNSGTISNAGSNVTINGTGAVDNEVGYIGGIAGYNGGTIQNSYNTGDLNVSQYVEAGGIVGYNGGSVSNSYNTGSVTSQQFAGGIAGYDEGSIADSLDSGLISAVSVWMEGGIDGEATSSNVTNSFWDTTTSGQSSAGNGVTTGSGFAQGGCVGCAINLGSASTYSGAGWTIGNSLTDTWVIVPLGSLPVSPSNYSTNLSNATQLQLIGLNATTLAATYTLDGNIDASATGNGTGIWGTAGFISLANFTGVFNGDNNTISNLTINDPSGTNVGLFGSSSGTINNINITNASVTGATQVGILAGTNTGQITNAYTSGSVVATETGIDERTGGI